MRSTLTFILCLCICTMTGCGDSPEDSSADATASGESAADATPRDDTNTPSDACTPETVDEDCPMISIAVWYPTCDGEVLQTPTGSGDMLCVEGQCQVDMTLVETDCAAEGKTCGANPEADTQGDACI